MQYKVTGKVQVTRVTMENTCSTYYDQTRKLVRLIGSEGLKSYTGDHADSVVAA
jgi:hypothetical protein